MAIIIDVIKLINNNPTSLNKINVVFAAPVQEELEMRGSRVVYESTNPDLVINIEAEIARDYPIQFTTDSVPKLGYGTTIFVYDDSMMPNQNLVQKLGEIAKRIIYPFNGS